MYCLHNFCSSEYCLCDLCGLSTTHVAPCRPSTTKYYFNPNSSFSPFLYSFLCIIQSHWFPHQLHFGNSSSPHFLQFHIFSFLQFHIFSLTLNCWFPDLLIDIKLLIFLIFSLTLNHYFLIFSLMKIGKNPYLNRYIFTSMMIILSMAIIQTRLNNRKWTRFWHIFQQVVNPFFASWIDALSDPFPLWYRNGCADYCILFLWLTPKKTNRMYSIPRKKHNTSTRTINVKMMKKYLFPFTIYFFVHANNIQPLDKLV